jgi:anti-sigma-K factor RskA
MFEETHVLDVLPAYALGSLEAEEASRVEEHLLSCSICRSEADSLRAVAEQLALAAPLAAPSPELKGRLMQRVRSGRSQQPAPAPAPKRPFIERLLPAWGVVSLFLIMALVGFNFILWQRLDQLEFTTAAGMRAVALSPADAASAATGFVLISADGEDGALVVDGLPPLGEDRQYQLWLIRNGQRTSGALFSTDEKDYGGTRIRAPLSLLEYSAVEITVEPAGGSPEPTGVEVLGGPLRKP